MTKTIIKTTALLALLLVTSIKLIDNIKRRERLNDLKQDVKVGQTYLYHGEDKNPFNSLFATNRVLVISNGYVLFLRQFNDIEFKTTNSASISWFLIGSTLIKD